MRRGRKEHGPGRESPSEGKGAELTRVQVSEAGEAGVGGTEMSARGPRSERGENNT